MFKKLFIVGAGVVLIVGLLFGTRSLALVSTLVDDIQQSAKNSIPIEMELRSATKEVGNLDKEIKSMTWEIAREENAVAKLETELKKADSQLDKSYADIMVLKDHLDGGTTSFVSHGQSYSNRKVESDLRVRFSTHKTMEATTDTQRQIFEARTAGLEAAREKYNETMTAKQELQVTIENLKARLQMVKVKETASELNFDNSHLSKTRELIDDIRTRIEVKEKVVNVTPELTGLIPLDDQAIESDDISNEVDAYFNGTTSDFAGVEK